MSIKGVGQNVAVHKELSQPKVEKPRVEPQKHEAPVENKTKANENALTSSIVKETLNRFFDKAEAAKTAPPEPPKPPIDYNEIDKQADELIKKHTSNGILGSGIGKDLDEQALGKDLADIARKDPARAAALIDNVYDKIEEGDRNGLAQNVIKNLNSDELRQFAKDDKGKEVLGQLKNKISGPFWDSHKDLINKAETAIKAADLEKSPEFQKLDKAVQGEVLARISKTEQDGKAVDNLIGLANDGNFAALKPETQRILLGATEGHAGDTAFTDSLKTLAAKPGFASRPANEQTQIVDRLRKFADSDAYQGSNGIFGVGSNHPSDAEKAAMLDKVGNTAIKTLDLQGNPDFQKLDKTVQTGILSRLEQNQLNEKVVDSLIDLTKNSDFGRLPAAVQQRMLQAFDNNKEDALFVNQLKQTAADANFQALSATQQTVVLNDLEKFTTTDSYKSSSVNDTSKTYMLGLIAGTSTYSQQHPSIVSVRNTLDKILSGDIKMESYSASDGLNGWADGKTIHMNSLANSVRPIEGQLDTFVHEVNHILNGPTDAGTPERFIDEYRARVVGREAGGRPFDATIEKASLDQLTSGGGAYQHLNDLYNSNADFKAVIDSVYADLNKTPPVTTTPEQLRQKLVDAGFDSNYLSSPNNIDNH